MHSAKLEIQFWDYLLGNVTSYFIYFFWVEGMSCRPEREPNDYNIFWALYRMFRHFAWLVDVRNLQCEISANSLEVGVYGNVKCPIVQGHQWTDDRDFRNSNEGRGRLKSQDSSDSNDSSYSHDIIYFRCLLGYLKIN